MWLQKLPVEGWAVAPVCVPGPMPPPIYVFEVAVNFRALCRKDIIRMDDGRWRTASLGVFTVGDVPALA